MTDRKIRWGILSTAHIARRVASAIHLAENSELVAVASRDLAKAQAYAAENHIPTAYGSYEALLSDPGIDAIYNPLPNHLHGEWSLRAAEAGKPVLCEKPLAADAAEALAMVEAFQGRGLLLAEAFMYRFHPQTLRVKALLDAGEIGKLQMISATFSFPQTRTADDIRLYKAMAGGAIMDVGCYCVSIIRLLAGDEPSHVEAYSEFNDDGVDLRSVGILAFPSGVMAHFDCAMNTGFANRYDVRGTTGRIEVPISFTPPADHPATLRVWRSRDTPYEEITLDPTDQYRLMIEDFADSLLNNRPPRYAADDSVRQMHALDQLRAAAERHRSDGRLTP